MLNQNSKLLRKILTSYAVTFIVINLADSLTMLADGMVISRGLGARALAAIALADPTYKLVMLFSGVLAVGMQVMGSQAMGSGDSKRASRIFSAVIVVMAAAAVILTAAGFVSMDGLCRLLGAGNDPELYSYLRDYLRGWFTGIPGFIIFFVLSPLVALDGNKKNVTAATFTESAVNIVGDLLSVFVLNKGVYGVGFCTGLSYNVASIILILNFFRKRSAFKPLHEKPDFKEMPQTIRNGLPRITEQISKILAPLIVNRTIIAIGGSIALSAASVKLSILNFCVIIGDGVAESVGLLAQILYSEKDANSLKKVVRSALAYLSTLCTAFGALLFVLAGLIARLYLTAGTEEYLLAVRVVRCLALSLTLNGCNRLVLKYLIATRKMVQGHVFTAFYRLISLAFFTAVLGRVFGTNGLFAAIPVSEAATFLGYIVTAFLVNRRKEFWDAMLLIPDGFGYNSENSSSFSIATVEEAVEVSERIEAFCSEHSVDRHTAYFSARCMEELSTNIVLHGFTQDDKKHHCDIRVMIDPDGVVLRLRDDCPYFNIRERYDSLTEDDMDSGLGIRLVYANAKSVNYINIFNTNTLIIRM